MSTDLAALTATRDANLAAITDLTWDKGRHKGRVAHSLRTAQGRTLGVVVVFPKVYVEKYGRQYGAGNWRVPVWAAEPGADGQPVLNTDPRGACEFAPRQLAAAKAWLESSVRSTSAEEIAQAYADVVADRTAQWDARMAREREVALF